MSGHDGEKEIKKRELRFKSILEETGFYSSMLKTYLVRSVLDCGYVVFE